MTFDKLQSSNHYIAVSVPSTDSISHAISREELEKRTAEISRELSARFGGASVMDVSGEWEASSGEYIREPIKRVMSYAQDIPPVVQESIIGLIKAKAREWGQEAIMVEVDNRAYFIN